MASSGAVVARHGQERAAKPSTKLAVNEPTVSLPSSKEVEPLVKLPGRPPAGLPPESDFLQDVRPHLLPTASPHPLPNARRHLLLEAQPHSLPEVRPHSLPEVQPHSLLKAQPHSLSGVGREYRERPKFLLELPPFDLQWSDVQRKIYETLLQRAPSTIRKCGQRFARNEIEGQRNYIPISVGADRSFAAALRLGTLLNALHPDPEIARRCLECYVDQRFPEPQDPMIALDLPDGSMELVVKEYEPREGRRKRLALLPDNWPVDMLDAAMKIQPFLRAGLLLLVLVGCRPIEVSMTTASWNNSRSRLDLTIRCAKRPKGRPELPGVRVVTLKCRGKYGRFVRELIELLAGSGTAVFGRATAKSLENLCRRISRKLWPALRLGFNASCCRNQLIADLKRDHVDRAVIADVVGHVSKRTASAYGTYQQGHKGARGYLPIERPKEADKEVAEHPRPRPSS